MDFVIIQGEWRGESSGSDASDNSSSLFTYMSCHSLAAPEVRCFASAGLLAALEVRCFARAGSLAVLEVRCFASAGSLASLGMTG